jgi:TonB family protein
MRRSRPSLPGLLPALLVAVLLAAPSSASAQSFYVMVVEWEGLSETSVAALEAALPGMARSCLARGSARRFALGQRVAVVSVGPDGRASAVELRSDDVSPSPLEAAFGRCMERALSTRTFDPPATQPAVVEIALEYARTVPDIHRPGGTGPRRGPRRAQASPHRAQGTGLPPERVREVAMQHADEVERCVATSVEGSRVLAGRIELEMTVQPDGHVEMITVVSSTTGVPAFDACIVDAARSWVFPAPGARVAIRYPLVVQSEVARTPPPEGGADAPR